VRHHAEVLTTMNARSRQSGIQLVEYAIMAAIVIGVGVYSVSRLSNSTGNRLGAVANCIQNSSSTSCP